MMSSFWDQWAIRSEHEVRHFRGSRCRDCGRINEPDPGYVVCLPRGLRCEGCGKQLPEPDVITEPGVDPLAELDRHFEPLVIPEGGE
jgi:hypothetical protein